MKTIKWGGERDDGIVKVDDTVYNLFDGLVIAEQKKRNWATPFTQMITFITSHLINIRRRWIGNSPACSSTGPMICFSAISWLLGTRLDKERSWGQPHSAESSLCSFTVNSANFMQMSFASIWREEKKQYNTILVPQKDFWNFQLIPESILNSD